MINFENYERVTVKNVGNYTQIKDNVSTLDCLKRLAELEDLIEKGKLVPKYYIVEDYLGYNLCARTTINMRCRDFYDTKEEAKAKLKELMESDENE